MLGTTPPAVSIYTEHVHHHIKPLTSPPPPASTVPTSSQPLPLHQSPQPTKPGKPRPPTLDEGLAILQRCHAELRRRFLVNSGGGLQVKVVDKDGCRPLSLPGLAVADDGGGGGGKGPGVPMRPPVPPAPVGGVKGG